MRIRHTLSIDLQCKVCDGVEAVVNKNERVCMGLQSGLEKIVASESRKKGCEEVVLGVWENGEFCFAGAGHWKGLEVGPETPFLIASTSKLFITTLLFQLVEAGQLSLEARVVEFFEGELDRLHVFRGCDYTPQITVGHLVTHTSGLPDYFEGKRSDGSCLASELFEGVDQAFNLEDVVRWTGREMSPAFAPGMEGRALYADTNFYLLSELLCRATGKRLQEMLVDQITDRLGLSCTRFFEPGVEAMPLRRGAQVLEIPKALASMPGDGGMVSTLADLIEFGRAFFDGRLFSKGLLDDSPPWRRVFFPLRAGTGVLRFALPQWLPPFKSGMEFLGHSGITGAFLFAFPKGGRILGGTVNQLEGRSRCYQMMVKAALAS
ncbi:MAG: serine hydrolase domain-containing protein [Puniceicoccaceae bacterium]